MGITSPSHSSPRELTLHAKDGYPLAASVFGPASPSAGTVVVLSATAVRRGYYARYAAYLAERGFRVVTFDYRGIGGSRPERLRGFAARLHEWAEQDAGGILAWAGPEPVRVLGHSFGGQALGLLPDTDAVRAAVMVAAGTGYWGHWSGARRLGLRLYWRAVIPVATRLWGYLPGWLLRGEDLPSGVAREWAFWGRHRGYVRQAGGPRWSGSYARLRCPIRVYGFSDDSYAPPPAVESLVSCYENAAVERRYLGPADLRVPQIGHWGFFRERFRDSLWAESADWLASR